LTWPDSRQECARPRARHASCRQRMTVRSSFRVLSSFAPLRLLHTRASHSSITFEHHIRASHSSTTRTPCQGRTRAASGASAQTCCASSRVQHAESKKAVGAGKQDRGSGQDLAGAPCSVCRYSPASCLRASAHNSTTSTLSCQEGNRKGTALISVSLCCMQHQAIPSDGGK
jgi:hypothetical protein